ncbi:hypothetical protein [Mycobacterium sp. RTGN4]|uniref:hypothetical protein n=1 Tax=Mycobacterium sp. RTGN4 TaxID=3016523 RepID=UPI0029C89CA6|nr:hypothetical protein [Mycobacterium sp. RTGN4]
MSARIAMLGRRVYAASAVCSAVLHAISLGHVSNVMAALLMMVMVIGCLYCARDIWLRGTLRAWVLVASMNLAMIAIHLPMSFTHHHGGGIGAAAPMSDSTAMTLATALAVLEVTVAAVVLFARTRAPQLVFNQPT